MLFFSYNLIPEFKPEQLEYAKEKEIFELIVKKLLENIEMLTKRGFSKGYVEEEENFRFLKGRILVEENLRQNCGLNNKIFCRYSEFTCDTMENRILKYTLYHLSRIKLSSNVLQKRVRQTIHFFDQVSLVVVYSKSFPKIIYTRLTEHYRPIINLCQLIIENSTLNLQKTGEIRYSSFLIDMNRLFESFLLGFLSKKLKGYNVRGEGRGMHDYSLDLMGEMTQKPDIIVRKNGIDLLVIDAKYKQLKINQNRQIDVIISDARQVWSYCRVPKTKMPFGILVYPKHQLIEQTKERYSLKENVCIILKALDLSNSSAASFEKECNSFAEEIVNLLNEKVIPVMDSTQTAP
jgi:5-methylcytosine-specific restriction enzyme subunit McrC